MGITKSEIEKVKSLKEIGLRYCPRCNQNKKLKDFSKRSGKQSRWYASRCKKCSVELTILWRKNNPEKYKKTI